MNLDPAWPTLVEPNLRSWIRKGQAYSIIYGQTVGAAGNGNYGISLFNPANSGKELYVFSIKGTTNFSSTNYMTVATTSTDPNYNTPVTPINMRSDIVTPSVANVTADSASISAPNTGVIELYNNADFFAYYGYLLTPGHGLVVVTFVNNSQQYNLGMKYAEFIGV